MPVYVAAQAIFAGIGSVPFLWPLIKLSPWVAAFLLAKVFFSGASNLSERKMNGKVVMVTGGTSGVGEAVVRSLALRGAQIVLLTQHPLSDPFIVEYIEDVRRATGNQLVTAEQVDLSSLYSIRLFATKWIDNAPPRRLDMVILCANTMPTKSRSQSLHEDVELTWQVNYLANFHLLTILSPALRAQPPDREVRVIVGSCSSYLGGDLPHSFSTARVEKGSSQAASEIKLRAPTESAPSKAYATSKLALVCFALAFQRRLTSYQRPDKAPPNVKVLLVDPGYCRTPGTRRWLSFGTLLGLLGYLSLYPVWWLLLKSPDMGAQSFLFASMDEQFSRGQGGLLIKECKERDFLRADVENEDLQENLWDHSTRLVTEAEKRGATRRAVAKPVLAHEAEEDVVHSSFEQGPVRRTNGGGRRNRTKRTEKLET